MVGDNGLGNDGGRAGGKEADKGDVSIGGNDGGKIGAGDDGHDGSAGVDGGGRVAHRENLMGDINAGCIDDSGASHGGGKDASKESLMDGACVGGGGGPFTSMALCDIAFAWLPSARAALMEVCKVVGKVGACVGGGGSPISTAWPEDSKRACCVEPSSWTEGGCVSVGNLSTASSSDVWCDCLACPTIHVFF